MRNLAFATEGLKSSYDDGGDRGDCGVMAIITMMMGIMNMIVELNS